MEKLEIGIIVTFILNFFYKKNLGWRDRSILCVLCSHVIILYSIISRLFD
jgi:hypothetical protein